MSVITKVDKFDFTPETSQDVVFHFRSPMWKIYFFLVHRSFKSFIYDFPSFVFAQFRIKLFCLYFMS